MNLGVFTGSPTFREPIHVTRPFLPSSADVKSVFEEISASHILTNNGPLQLRLEKALAKRLQVEYVVAVGNATVGLEILFRALGLGGNAVLPSFTFIATAHALRMEGVSPMFADIEPRYAMLNPRAADGAIDRETTAIVGVHLFGNACDAPALEALGKTRKLPVIFDAAQALGTRMRGCPVGGFGVAEVFSLHATKIINGLEGGFVTTKDASLARELQWLRNFGFSSYDRVERLGTNAKMNEFSAGVALNSLPYLDGLIEKNRHVHERYRLILGGIPGLQLPEVPEGCESNFSCYPIRVGKEFGLTRDQLCDVLWKENVIARRYYYPGCHRQAPYRDQPPLRDLRQTEVVCDETLSLPCFPSLTDVEIRSTANVIRAAHDAAARLTAHYKEKSVDERIFRL